MREKNYNISAQLDEVRETFCPDWRLGQFIMNFFNFVMHTTGRDPFYMEDNALAAMLKKYQEYIIETMR